MSREIIKTGEIGAIIRKRRNEFGWSQEQLAEKVGVSYQQVQRYENGDSMLNVENVQRIAKALSLPMSAFFETVMAETVGESVTPYFSPEEKTLLKAYRSLTAVSDRKLVISVIKRVARK